MGDLPRSGAFPMGRTWDDSSTAVINLPSGGTAPVRTAMQAGGSVFGMAYNDNDLCDFHIQTSHKTSKGSDFRLHVHFMFPTNPTAGRHIRFEMYYTFAAVNAAFAGQVGPVYSDDYVIPAADGGIHRATHVTTLVLPGSAHSVWIAGRCRKVAPLTGTDTDVNPILGFVDGHHQQDYFGTEGEWA